MKIFKKGKPLLVLAPMAGITDSSFRLICKKYGADFVYSEMVSADGLIYGKKSWELAKFSQKERPIAIQIFGKKPEVMAQAAKLIVEKIKPEVIDINMGCPAKKVINSQHGAYLIKNPDLACEIVSQIKKAVGKKALVSVKTRLGWENKNDILTFAPRLEKAGMDFLCLHGRTYKQGFSGEVDYQMIAKVKAKLRVPVIANGGITSPQQAVEVLKITKADGIAIGLGALGHPWIFSQIKGYFKIGKVKEFTWPQTKKLILEQAKAAYKTKGKHGIIEMRKHLCWYVKGLPNATDLRERLVRVETVEDIRKILKTCNS